MVERSRQPDFIVATRGPLVVANEGGHYLAYSTEEDPNWSVEYRLVDSTWRAHDVPIIATPKNLRGRRWVCPLSALQAACLVAWAGFDLTDDAWKGKAFVDKVVRARLAFMPLQALTADQPLQLLTVTPEVVAPAKGNLMDTLRGLVLDGLGIEGDHHKQWFLWQVAGLVLSPLELEQAREICEPGIAP